jgi:lysophospholipase L1-like esterase
MKKILCFGDSNTYGFVPKSGERYDKNTRWTGVLQKFCQNEFEIIEAGCNNRTAFSDSNDGIFQTGYKILPKFLQENPDIVILSIGINDIQKFYNPTLEQIKVGITSLVEKANPERTILIAPPKLDENVLNGVFAFQFDEISVEKSKHIGEIYKSISQEKHCKFINLDDYINVSAKDGLHYEPKDHYIVAQTVLDCLRKPSKEIC